MFRTQREKRLAVSLGGSLCFVVLWNLTGELLLRPVTALQDDIRSLTLRNADLEQSAAHLDLVARDIRETAARSLPAGPGTATALYQAWTIRQLSECGIHQASVSPGPPIPEDGTGHRIAMFVECTAPCVSIAKFLDRFHGTPLLHRITHLSVSSTSGGARDELKLSLTLEALALTVATDQLSLPDPEPHHMNTGLLSVLTGRNIFCRTEHVFPAVQGSEKESDQETPGSAEPEPADPSPHSSTGLRFVASVWNGRHREAWFTDSETHSEQVGSAQVSIPVGHHSASVVSVTEEDVTILLEGQQIRVRLGQLLSDGQPLQVSDQPL